MMFNLHFHKYEILDMIEYSIYKKCKVCGKVIVECDNLTGVDILTFNSSEQECINHRKLYDRIKSDSIRLKLIDTLKLQSKSKFTKRRTQPMKATILIGLPMSGKSTYAKLNKGNSVIIDCDYLRMMLTGDNDKYKAFNKANESIVWETFYDMLSTCKIKNKDIIIGNTNCNLSKLKVLIDVFREYEIEFVVMNTPKSICVSRLPSDAQYMIEIIDKFEEEMIQTVKWLEDNKYNITIL